MEKLIAFAYSDLIDINNGEVLREYIRKVKQKYIAFCFKRIQIISEKDFEAVINRTIGINMCAGIYSYFNSADGKVVRLQDYTIGSALRDGFDFGGMLVVNTEYAKEASFSVMPTAKKAAFYDLLLRLIPLGGIKIVPEPLYIMPEEKGNDFETKNFAYVDPRNREYQQECETIFKVVLEDMGALLPPITKSPKGFAQEVKKFKNLVSVIIPVKNRESTIETALRSAAEQKTDFPYNIIVVDNHSTDRTADVIAKMQGLYPDNIVRIVPDNIGFGIGGCWNLAIDHPECGAFAVQLDSDDGYSHENVLQVIADKFRKEKCAMLVGSYQLTNADFEPLDVPPITHSEYTPENGHNNLLRVNGVGAPRCFFTPVIRQIRFPNVSYGEDYAVALHISGEYKVSRIFDVLYNCRRWSGNSDANPSHEAQIQNNYVKDLFRERELSRRYTLINGEE
ncbi:MAG: glycosyltransferase family 2 protein [Bacteroidales bacterium]|nr:glycosyltransferase family 2 protein [Bacteroidales bacterium]